MSTAEFDRYCMVSIQGGGIFGLATLGQLQAVEDARLSIISYAGSSAGAIVAALAWSGYKAEAILEEFLHLLNHPQGIEQLFGKFDLVDGARLTPRTVKNRVGEVGGLVSRYTRRGSRRMGRVSRILHACSCLKDFLGHTSTAALGSRIFSRRGAFAGDRLEEWLNELLRKRLTDVGYDVEQPTFRDFYLASHVERKIGPQPALFLTVTNIGTRKVELIDSISEGYADVPVSRAIRASAGFPGFFRPTELTVITDEKGNPLLCGSKDGPPREERTGWYVDGGVIANFPLWASARYIRNRLWHSSQEHNGQAEPLFRALAYRPVFHFGLRLTPTESRYPYAEHGLLKRPKQYWRALYSLLSSGARNFLEEELVESVERRIRVRQSYRTSGFRGGFLDVEGLNRRTAHSMFTTARATAKADFDQYSFELPSSSSSKGRAIQTEIEGLCRRVRQVLMVAGANPERRVRASVYLCEGTLLLSQYRANFEEADRDRLTALSLNQGVVGLSMQERHMILCNPQLATEMGDYFGMTRAQLDAVRPGTNWMVATPIMDACEPRKWSEVAAQQLTECGGTVSDHLELVGPASGGSTFGVLVVDAIVEFGKLPKRPKEQVHSDDIRMVLDLISATEQRVGAILAYSFADRITAS